MADTIPLWLPVSYSLFLLVLVPVYWKHYGPSNFLWFSDIALFAICIVLWSESRLLLSMMAVGVLGLELVWNIDYFGRLLTGRRLLGLSDYMFQSELGLFLRSLSLFHVLLPVLIIWLLAEWGYDERALYFQIVLAWSVLTMTYLFTDPKENINWVFGVRNLLQHKIAPGLYFVLVMLFFPAIVFLPSHFLLILLFN